MSKKQDCDHIIGYLGRTSAIHGSCGTSASVRVGEDEKHAELIRASEGYTFGDFAAEGQKFNYCPFCGHHFEWKNPEAE